jgi:hypothetical protein
MSEPRQRLCGYSRLPCPSAIRPSNPPPEKPNVLIGEETEKVMLYLDSETLRTGALGTNP